MRPAIAITGAGTVTAPDGKRSVDEAALGALPPAVRARASRAERVTQLVLVAGGLALEDAGLVALEGPARPRLGVVVGTAFGCALTNAAYAERLAEGGPLAASPRLFAATVSNAAAGELSIAYRLGGPCVTLTAGTAAGLAAVAHAVDVLRAGRADAVVAGGADAFGDDLGGAMASAGLCAAVDGASLFVLGPLRNGAIGTVLGCATGFAAADAVLDDALAEAGVAAADVAYATVCGDEPGRLAGRLPSASSFAPILPAPSAARAPLALRAALATARPADVVVVVDVCATGHVAAVVARAAGVA